MKRIHLFEFEDLAWFPHWIRECMTRYIATFHRLLNTKEQLADLVADALKKSGAKNILDMCSGSGGLMLDVANVLKEKHQVKDVNLTLSDLYPNLSAAKAINKDQSSGVSYLETSLDATDVSSQYEGLRTMICSMHHMRPEVAKNILRNAKESRQPICVYEISDNSAPIFIWWIAIPISLIITLFVTPFVRPMSWQQLVFTYLIPILPLAIAWDGAVSNARTYTLSDMDELLEGLEDDTYGWEKGSLEGKGGKKLYLLGCPK